MLQQRIRRASGLAGFALLALNLQLGAQATDRLTVTEVWVADGNTRLEELTRITGAAESPLGTVWIASSRPGMVLAVAPNGDKSDDFLVARDGDGPGELRGPGRVDVMPDGNMAVHDIGRNAVEVYTPAGEPVRRVIMPISVGWIKGFAALPGGGFVLSGGVFGNGHAIHQFDELGGYLHSWGEAMEAEDMMARFVGTGGALDVLPDGSLLYSRAAPHEIVRYQLPTSGSVAPSGRTIVSIGGLLESPGDDVLLKTTDENGVSYTTFRVWYPQSRGVFLMADGAILNVITHSNEDPELRHTIWQLFSPSGDLEAEARTDGVMYQPWFQCSNGDILASRHDVLGVTSLVRLRVNFNGGSSG